MIAVTIITAALVPDNAQAAEAGLLGWLLILLVVMDLRYRILPDALTAALLASGLSIALVLRTTDFVEALFGAAVGGGSFLLLRFLYHRLRGTEGLGLGDVKMMTGLGAWFGPSWLPLLVLVAATAGLLIAFLKAWKDGTGVSATTIVPFGAYLGGGAVLLWSLKATHGWGW